MANTVCIPIGVQHGGRSIHSKEENGIIQGTATWLVSLLALVRKGTFDSINVLNLLDALRRAGFPGTYD